MSDDPRFQAVYRRLYSEAVLRRGYLGDEEAAARGLSPELRRAAIASGVFLQFAPGVMRLAIFPPSPFERVIAAWHAMGTRGVCSHTTALALEGLCALGEVIHLTYPADAQPAVAATPPDIAVHLIEGPPSKKVWREGLPVTSIERAFSDCLASATDAAVVEAALAKARRRKLMPPASGAPNAPAVRDPILGIAIKEALGQVDEVEGALERPVPADGGELGPLQSLAWRDDAELLAAIPERHDGVILELDGIEFFSALETLDLRLSRLSSLAPLSGLEELVAAHLGVTPTTSLEPLLSCPSLRRVRLDGFDPAVHGAARAQLEARGVIVDVTAAPLPSSPFVDPMLKLAVLEALARGGLVTVPPLVPIDELELDREHLTRVLAHALDDGLLAQVEELVWSGGGMKLQHLVWPQYDGESDEFRITTLAGIERLPNLRRVRLEYGAFDPDSDELASLRARGVDVEVVP